ncbi:MAG: recombinase family protein [Methanocellales archaeon]|nr:recombinase family protein [Methanocellales archaeon]MDD3292114.1 recombinase family protein [Methanocellales archaeon]MDD5235351.1 recombinase family protein [Methanocellales archaeon]MDD5485701.1 recombinase family protein [Methanocellales archaeon]
MKNALAYARVSTKEQADKGLSIPAQLKAIKEYANSHDLRVLEEFVDQGESAKTADRPGFRKMMKRCQKDKTIEAVLVHKIDRFSRNNIDFYAYKAILKKEGVRLLSVSENIEENPSGEFIENVLVAMAQFYSSNLAEEVLKGMKEKFEKGEWPVKAPIGYKHLRDERGRSQVIEDKNSSYLIKQMFKLYSTGQYSLGSLSEEMANRGLKTKNGKLFSHERIKQILQNKFYMGRMEMWNKGVKGKHQPIIEEPLFNQVQNILSERKITQDRWQKRDFLLRGLVYCQGCQRRLTAEIHQRGDYYRCQSSVNHKCSQPYLPVRSLESQIKALYDLMEPPIKLLKLIKAEIEEVQLNFKAKSSNEIANLKRKINENEAKMDALVDNLATRTITPEVYKKYGQRYEKEIKNARDRLAVLENDYSSNFDFIDKCMILSSTLSRLHKIFSFRQKKNLARAIFKRIWVKQREIKRIELNPPFDFLLKSQARKIRSAFPHIKFEHYPVKSTTKDIFEHLVGAMDFPAFYFVNSLVKGCKSSNGTRS